jgi:predicted transcriptional regulator of viral defense system
MKLDLLHPFESMPYITIEGFRQAASMENPDQVRMLLYRWAKAGHIVPIKKGMYMTRRFFDLHSSDASFPAMVSAILLPQSYLSLEYILQRHNILTEVTYPITAITTKNTRRIVNRLGIFQYRNIRPDLYHGFKISEYFGVRYAEASVSKALFDHLYLRSIPAAFRSLNINLAEDLRLNIDELSYKERQEFGLYVEESGNRKMWQIYENFRSTLWQP